MSARTVAVLITLAFLLGMGGALWAVDVLRAPEPSSVDPIELEEGDGSDERERGEERKASRPGDSDDSSEGAPVAPPPPPVRPDDDGDDDGDDESDDDGDD